MAEIIHAKQGPDGMRFRTWSDTVDSYTSKEVDENQLRHLMLYLAVRTALREYNQGIEGRIERTKAYGTSEFNSTRSLDRWDRQRTTGQAFSDMDIEAFRKQRDQDKANLISLLEHWDEI